MVRGLGTAVNAATIVAGSALGVALGGRLPQRTRDMVTDALGLVVLLVAAGSATSATSPALVAATGRGGPVLVVLASAVLGGVLGSLLRLETRLEALGQALRRRLSRGGGSRFVEGFVVASLVFCVGPLALLGAIQDGLGRGISLLALKATLDGFASLAFAAALGWGVAASVLPVVVLQTAFTVVGVTLGGLLSAAQVAALDATGGLLLVGVSIRLLRLRPLPVADLLPALAVAPVAELVVQALH